MDDGVSIEVIHGGHDAIFEFLFGCDADMAQHQRASLEKKPSTRFEPGAVLGREGQFEGASAGGRASAGRSGAEPSRGGAGLSAARPSARMVPHHRPVSGRSAILRGGDKSG